MSQKDEDNNDKNFEELDLSEFGIESDEVLDTRNMSEKNNISRLSRRLKDVNSSVETMEDALYDIIWNLDNIIEENETNGNVFQNDCQQATEKLLEMIESTHQMLAAFEKMKALKDNLNQ